MFETVKTGAASRRMRVLLAAGAVALTAFGVSQAVDTSAAATDAVTATSGDISAAGDLLPAVDSSRYGCWNDDYGSGASGAVIYFKPVEPYNPNFTYRLIVSQLNGTVVDTWDLDPGPDDTPNIWIDKNVVGGHIGWDYLTRLYTVNPAGELSTAYRGTKIHQSALNTTYCDGDASGADPQPAAFAADESGPAVQALAPTSTSTPGQSATPATEPSITETSAPETTTPESTTPETSTPSATPPAAKTPASPVTPGVSTPGTSSPSGSTPQSPTSGASTSGTTSPDISTPGTTAATSRAGSTPESSTPETSPETSAPVTAPGTTAPSTSDTSASTPSVQSGVVSGPFALGGDAGLQAQIVSDAGTRRVVVLDGAAEVCRTSTPVSASERILDTGDGTLLISGNGAVREVDTGTCAIS